MDNWTTSGMYGRWSSGICFIGWFILIGVGYCDERNGINAPSDDHPTQPVPGHEATSKLMNLCFGLDIDNRDLDGSVERLSNLIHSSNQLSCQFGKDSFETCCYGNEMIRNHPEKTLVWSLAEGAINKQRFRRCFDTFQLPENGFLVTSSRIGGIGQQAQLHSCSIVCANSIIVKIRHWQRKTVFQICQRGSFDLDQDEWSCTKLKRTTQGEMTEVELPGGEFVEVVVIAEISRNGIAVIDDISVTIMPCTDEISKIQKTSANNETETQWEETCNNSSSSSDPTSTSDNSASTECVQLAHLKQEVCAKIACDFEEGTPCSWNPLANNYRNHAWQISNGAIGNLRTGVDHPANETKFFMGSLLDPFSSMVLHLPDLHITRMDGWAIRFAYWLSTYEARISVFLNGMPVNFNLLDETTTVSQQLPYRGWRWAIVPLDRDLKEISFIAINAGLNFGAIGLDEINIVRIGYTSSVCA